MQVKTKGRAVIFTHDDSFRGDVLIERGGERLSVPIEDVLALVAAKIRHDMLDRVQRMSAGELLGAGAARVGIDVTKFA